MDTSPHSGHSAPGLRTSSRAIASLVLGVGSIALFPLALILSPLAIGLWSAARNEISQVPPRFSGRGLAIAGLITGLFGLFFSLFVYASLALVIRYAPHLL